MISIVTKAAIKAKTAHSKKVTAQHLKSVVQEETSFDFLAETVEKVPEGPATKKEDDSEGTDGKRKRGPGRRKKGNDDDDDYYA